MITILILSIVLAALIVYSVCFGWAAWLIAIVAIVITVCVTVGIVKIVRAIRNKPRTARG